MKNLEAIIEISNKQKEVFLKKKIFGILEIIIFQLD